MATIAQLLAQCHPAQFSGTHHVVVLHFLLITFFLTVVFDFLLVFTVILFFNCVVKVVCMRWMNLSS
jgi:hypothetical protein